MKRKACKKTRMKESARKVDFQSMVTETKGRKELFQRGNDQQ